jgi:glutathione S-transferase
MKLYYFPGSCALGIDVLLEEAGVTFEPILVDFKVSAQRSPEYLAINPKGKVPFLVRDNGNTLGEWPAIALYLARRYPEAGLLPSDPEDEADALSLMEYIVSTVHMQAFARIFRSERFTPNEADRPAVAAQGRQMYIDGLAMIDQKLEGRDYVAGGRFSIADAAVLFVSFWAKRGDFPMGPNLTAHFARMKQRPAVQRAFAREGLPL